VSGNDGGEVLYLIGRQLCHLEIVHCDVILITCDRVEGVSKLLW